MSRETSCTPTERETVVNASDGDELTRITTGQRRFITRLRKHPSFTEVRTWHEGTTEWAEFTIPAGQWNPASGAKRKTRALTDAERAAAAERLAKARAAS